MRLLFSAIQSKESPITAESTAIAAYIYGIGKPVQASSMINGLFASINIANYG